MPRTQSCGRASSYTTRRRDESQDLTGHIGENGHNDPMIDLEAVQRKDYEHSWTAMRVLRKFHSKNISDCCKSKQLR